MQIDQHLSRSIKGQALLTLTYVTILLNVGSAISTLVLTDEFCSLTLRASRTTAASAGYLEMGKYDEPYTDLITRFNGGRRTWKLLAYYCEYKHTELAATFNVVLQQGCL